MNEGIPDKNRKLFPFEEEVRKFLEPVIKDKVVLDVGGYDGRQAAWCLEHGAKKALSIDNSEWQLYDRWNPFDPYPGVKYIYGDFYQYDRMVDVTIFQNVIYHQKNPWKALEKVRSLTREVMVLSTSFIEGDDSVWRVYDATDADSNYLTVSWRPTEKGLRTLLKNTGFIDVEGVKVDGHIIVKCIL